MLGVSRVDALAQLSVRGPRSVVGLLVAGAMTLCAVGYPHVAMARGTAQEAAHAHAATATAAPVAMTGRVFVMRHLRTEVGADPALSPEGARAAAALAAQLKDAGITRIHVTATRRSRETAAPLAAALGIAPDVYDPRDPAALMARLAAGPGAALVVGHSNTVPDLVARAGGTAPPPLGHDDFGGLWLVEPGGETRLLEAGGPLPPQLK